MWLLSIVLLLCPADTLDDRRAAVDSAVRAYTEPLQLPVDTTAMLVDWADLNGDGREDALVYLSGNAWCGTGGCTLLVFEAMDEIDADEFGDYRPAAEISLMHGPVRVVESDGIWCDLIVEGEDGAMRRLRFDGETYPMSPGGATLVEGSVPVGRVLFADQ